MRTAGSADWQWGPSPSALRSLAWIWLWIGHDGKSLGSDSCLMALGGSPASSSWTGVHCSNGDGHAWLKLMALVSVLSWETWHGMPSSHLDANQNISEGEAVFWVRALTHRAQECLVLQLDTHFQDSRQGLLLQRCCNARGRILHLSMLHHKVMSPTMCVHHYEPLKWGFPQLWVLEKFVLQHQFSKQAIPLVMPRSYVQCHKESALYVHDLKGLPPDLYQPGFIHRSTGSCLNLAPLFQMNLCPLVFLVPVNTFGCFYLFCLWRYHRTRMTKC